MADGMVCYHHPSQQAVAQCGKCGKGICKDCCDVYGVESGEFAGRALCYDCTVAEVEDNVKMATTLRKIVKTEFTFIIAGVVIGAIVGGLLMGSSNGDIGSVFTGIILFGLLGGCGWSVLKALGLMISGGGDLGVHGNYGGLGKMLRGFGMIIIAPIRTIIKIVSRSRQIKELAAIAASDSLAIEEMKAYFAYTKVIEENRGVELATLTTSGGALVENKYAQKVLSNGENAAKASLCQEVKQIYHNNDRLTGFIGKKLQVLNSK